MKRLLPFAVLPVILTLAAQTTYANSILTITPDGATRVNVLSAESSRTVTVTNVVNDSKVGDNAKIALDNLDGKTTVDVSSDSGSKKIDATNYRGELVTVEERPGSHKIEVVKSDNGFVLRQEGVSVTTNYPVRIDAERGELSVVTSNGIQHLLRMPLDVSQNLVNLKVMDQNTPALTLEEGTRGELLYKVSGEKSYHLLNLINLSSPVSSQVSASTGEVISIDEPLWMKLLGVLLG